MGSIATALNALPAFRVLVTGGSYAGLSAALNLQDLCRGRAARCGPPPAAGEGEEGSDASSNSSSSSSTPDIAVDITIVDERDGFCK